MKEGTRAQRAGKIHSTLGLVIDSISAEVDHPQKLSAAKDYWFGFYDKRLDEYNQAEKQNIDQLKKMLLMVLAARFGEAFTPAKSDVEAIFEDYTKAELGL